MRLSWCTLHWLISATWLWPKPWKWALGVTPMGLLEQARLSQSKPWGAYSDAKYWCSTVMRYKDAPGKYVVVFMCQPQLYFYLTLFFLFWEQVGNDHVPAMHISDHSTWDRTHKNTHKGGLVIENNFKKEHLRRPFICFLSTCFPGYRCKVNGTDLRRPGEVWSMGLLWRV